jgi:hypothetical protein
MNPLVNFIPGQKATPNYWEIDNQLAFIPPFKELYDLDKSKGKKDSSLKMWAIAFYCHPDSRIINYPEKEKRGLIETDIVGDKIEWNKLEGFIKDYKNLYLTQAKRSLVNWKIKLEERDDYLMSIPYNTLPLEDAAKLDKLLADTPKLFKQYEDIKELIQEEDAKVINKAGIQESAAEKQLI